MSALTVDDPRSEGILFDLFGTLVFFDATRLPRVRVGEVERPATITSAADLLSRLSPSPTLDELYAALRTVSLEFEEEANRTCRERPSRERFYHALSRLGASGDLVAIAEELSARHMIGLAQAVVCPEDRRGLLRELRRRYRIALVSNFDHTATAHMILRRDGLAELFDAVVVSDEVGLRKPHRHLFELACERIGLETSACLHVGDSHRADICGATEAGVEAVWIDESDTPAAPAVGRIADVRQLPEWLAQRDRG
jgi:HAD superfamily hydrolase (TIGR01549 family)